MVSHRAQQIFQNAKRIHAAKHAAAKRKHAAAKRKHAAAKRKNAAAKHAAKHAQRKDKPNAKYSPDNCMKDIQIEDILQWPRGLAGGINLKSFQNRRNVQRKNATHTRPAQTSGRNKT